MGWPTEAMALKAAQGALSGVDEVALFSTVPGEFPGTELVSAGYVRQPVTWTVVDGKFTSGPLTYAIASGVTVRGFGMYEDGVFVGGGSLLERHFLAGGSYKLTISAGGQ